MAYRKHELPRKRVDAAARRRLRQIIDRAHRDNDLRTWSRARAVLGYIEGQSAGELAQELRVDPSAVFKWLAAYAARGLPALTPGKAPGAAPKLSPAQLEQLGAAIDHGPGEAGFESGVWTARMITEYIRREFGVEYNWKYVPDLLHRLGFSVQRPRKRLARADHRAQARWLREVFPAIKKKPRMKALS